MSIGIYKYQNKINQKIYIGQSSNIERRYEQHLYAAKHPHEKNILIDKAISKYGIENFTFEIIEICSLEELDEKECYWIGYYNSYNNGYNNTIGGKSVNGENHPRALLTKQQVWEIREMYKQRIQRNLAYKKVEHLKITKRGFLKIWNGETWCDVHMDVYTPENKKWHKQHCNTLKDQHNFSSLDRAIGQEEINKWCMEYQQGLSVNAIAKKYNRDNGTVAKYLNNPNAINQINYRGRTVKNINTGLIFKSISAAAKWANCGATTLTRHLATDGVAGKGPDTNEPAKWVELS